MGFRMLVSVCWSNTEQARFFRFLVRFRVWLEKRHIKGEIIIIIISEIKS